MSLGYSPRSRSRVGNTPFTSCLCVTSHKSGFARPVLTTLPARTFGLDSHLYEVQPAHCGRRTLPRHPQSAESRDALPHFRDHTLAVGLPFLPRTASSLRVFRCIPVRPLAIDGGRAGPLRQLAPLTSWHRSSSCGPSSLRRRVLANSLGCPGVRVSLVSEDTPPPRTRRRYRCPTRPSRSPRPRRSASSTPICYVTEPEPDAVERLTRGALSLYDTSGGDLVEFECDVYGESVSWLSVDTIDALVYGG